MLASNILKQRYRIYDTIGQKGRNQLYLARDLWTGRMVTIKLVRNTVVENVAGQLLLREMRLLQQISSRHVVNIYDYAINHTQPDLPDAISFLVLEYVQGLSLEDLLQRLGTLSALNTLALARQVVLALVELHARGMIHRDLKAANLMVSTANQVKLIDFGVSKQLNTETITRPGEFLGSLQTASPEQLQDSRQVDIRSDLYSLGVVMAQCLIGKLPQRNSQGQHVLPAEMLNQRIGEPHATEAFALITRLLSLAPSDRFLVPDALLERLDMLLQQTELLIPWGQINAPSTPLASTAGASLVPGISSIPAPATPAAWLQAVGGLRIPLELPEIRIGRASPSDPSWRPEIDVEALHLEKSATVSRLHCSIFADQHGQYYLGDMGSFNGTYLNDQQLTQGNSYLLRNGDLIELGGVKFLYQTHS